jgi:large subunit ribosomal protein L17
MRKRAKGRKLSRKHDQRLALLKGLATNLFLKEKIKTTEAKAKELAVFAEKGITTAKKTGFSAKRLLARTYSAKLIKKLTEDIALRYKERQGGYTRIIKLGPRKSDGAKMAIIELVK